MLLRFYRKIVPGVVFLGVQAIANKTRSISGHPWWGRPKATPTTIIHLDG